MPLHREHVARPQVNDPDTVAKVFNCFRLVPMRPGEDVHQYTHFAQSASQLTDMNVHTPRFALTGWSQRAGVNREEGYPCCGQFLVTTI